jgi:2-(1,2-epoxy-1,2-dihydrophenyl)acetyl-CoA isomerase
VTALNLETVDCERVDGVAWVSLNRPEIGAEQALDWGLSNRVVDDEQLHAAVTELAQRLAAGPPGSYATIKRTINARTYDGFAESLDLEAQLQQERADSKDFMEGVVSFVQKRPPTFTGE